MNYIEITGGTKSQRAIADKVVSWYLKRVLPRVRTLDITVRLTNCLKNEGAYGYCLELDSHKEFDIEIDKTLRLFDFVSTLCHEMTHLKQYYRKEMVALDGGRIRWKKKVYNSNFKYENKPWEKEAFKVEAQLARDCFTDLL